MNSNIIIDVVLGLSWGDEGKGKVTKSLLEEDEYTHCMRFNGGGNAGHTVYHNGVKIVTHLIPAGVFYGIPSIIGPGCVINIRKFFEEIRMLRSHGIDTSSVSIAENAHIVTEYHIEEDSKDTHIGTTKSGNGPAYRDKYARIGRQAKDYKILQSFLINIHNEFYKSGKQSKILMEGAQGFNLDIDHGDYPFVTSSHCSTAGALLAGFAPQCIRHVWGVAKVYDTYVGTLEFQPSDADLHRVQEVGEEFGATTGRVRKCNWLNLPKLLHSMEVNGVTHLVLNKFDILREIGIWKAILKDNMIAEFDKEEDFISFLFRELPSNITVYHSYSPERL